MLIAALASGAAHGAPQAVTPLPNAHAHNDYLHDRPLLDALDRGFTSVEADVFLVNGTLLVGHERESLKPERTLEELYLTPLAERIRQNGGHVHPKVDRFFLLIDIKDDPRKTYGELKKLLAKCAQMLTSVEGGKVRPGPVTIVLTGNRPKISRDDPHLRYCALDGRLPDLDTKSPAHLVSMISDDWTKQFHWDGSGSIPADDRAKLRETCKKAHASGRVVRFWKTPENENIWRELRGAGVDLINTDQLDRLAAFLRAAENVPR